MTQKNNWPTQFVDTSLSGGKEGLTVNINPAFASDVTNRLKPYKSLPAKMRPALEKVGDYIRFQMIPDVFAAEGPGWRSLSKRTQRERAAEGYGANHPILRRSGDLFRELTEKSHPKHVEIIKTGKYARITISGSSEKFIRNQGGNWQLHIPPRPMIPGTGNIPVRNRDQYEIKRILETGIRQAMK